MAHWFDALARPHTRRTALKAAGFAGAALLLPLRAPQTAGALTAEPCYRPCMDLAQAAQNQAGELCDKHYGIKGFGESAPLVGGLLTSLRNDRWIYCKALANTRAHTAKYHCASDEECGDPSRYPFGGAPTPVPVSNPACGEGKFVDCGDQPCCNLAYASCVGCSGGPVCCRNGGNCCG